MLWSDDWDLDDRDKRLEAIGFLNADAGRTGLDDALPNRFRGSAGLPFEFPFGVGEVLEVIPFLQPGIDELFVAAIQIEVLLDESGFPLWKARNGKGRFRVLLVEAPRPNREADDFDVDAFVEFIPGIQNVDGMIVQMVPRIRDVVFENPQNGAFLFVPEVAEIQLKGFISVFWIIDARDVDPWTDLRHAEIKRREDKWILRDSITQGVEGFADDLVGVSAIVGDQVLDVLQHDVFRMLGL